MRSTVMHGTSVPLTATLSVLVAGCGLLIDADPQASVRDGGGGGRADASGAPGPDAGDADALLVFDGGRGGLRVDCVEGETWREEVGVAEGLIDVASRGDEVAVVYHQARDRALVQVLDASLVPVTEYTLDAALDPTRLTTTDRGFALLQSTGDTAAIVEPTGALAGALSAVVTAAGLSHPGGSFSTVAAIVYGPSLASPGLLEVVAATRVAVIRSAPALGDASAVLDARIEHSPVSDAYIVAYAEPTGVRIVAFDRGSMTLVAPPVDVIPSAATASSTPDLSLAVSEDRAAVAMQTDLATTFAPDVAIVDPSATVTHLWGTGAAGTAAAVASLPSSPFLGVARVVAGELLFELRGWADGAFLASVPVTAPTEGDVLDIEAEPTEGTYLLARKPRAGGTATVTRVRCAFAP